VAKKGQKRSATRKAAGKPAKAARAPAGRAPVKTTSKGKPPAPPTRDLPAVPPAPRAVGPTPGEEAERLRDEIQRSKLTHPDPWRYAAKARAWGERVQALVEQIAAGDQTPAVRRALSTLAGEVQADRDFQEARRLF
jgi:hypothetical protein